MYNGNWGKWIRAECNQNVMNSWEMGVLIKEVAGNRFWLQWHVSDIAWCMFDEFTYSMRSSTVYKLKTFCFHLIVPRECQRNPDSRNPLLLGLFVRNEEWSQAAPCNGIAGLADKCPRAAPWSQYDILVYFKSTSTPTAIENFGPPDLISAQ